MRGGGSGKILMEKESKLVSIADGVIRWGIYALVLIFPLFFLPFNSSILEINKQLALTVFTLVLLIAWIGRTIAQGKLILKKSFANIVILLFLIFYLVSSLLSKGIYQAMVGFGGSVAESFSSVLGLAILFFVILNNLKKRDEALNVLFALTVSGLAAGIFALLQLSGFFVLPWDFAKTASFNSIGSVNALEIFLGSLLVLSSVLFVQTGMARWRQIFYGVAAGFFLFMALSINFSNVWWALLLATVIIIGLGIINREQMNQYRLILPMVVLAFAVLMLLVKPGFFTWSSVPVEVSPTLGATIDIDKQVLKEKLFFGSGPGSFAYDYGLHRSPDLNQTAFWNIRFNQGLSKIFSQPATLGIFGWLSWMTLLVGAAVYGFVKLVKGRGASWVLGLGIYSSWLTLAFLQFLYPTNLTLEAVFWMMLALMVFSLKMLAQEDKEEGKKEEVMKIEFERNSPLASVLSFVFVGILVVAISVLYLGGTYWWADVLYQRGLATVSQKNDLEGGSAVISRAVMLNPYNDLYLRTLSQAALLRIDQELAKPQSVERDGRIQNLIATAINIAKRSTDLASLNADNWVQRAVIYRAVMPYLGGAEQWAADSYNEAVKLEPQNPFYYWELGRTYSLAADLLSPAAAKDKEKEAKVQEYLSKAEAAFQSSLGVKGDYAPAAFNLALVYDRQGKTEEGIKKMEQAQSLNPNDIGITFQLGLLYYKKSDWEGAKAQFERAVSLDNNYSNARYFLGLVYDKIGKKDAAIEQFEKVAQLNPGNQDVETILENLKSGKPAISQIPQQPAQLPITEKQPEEVPPEPGLKR